MSETITMGDVVFMVPICHIKGSQKGTTRAVVVPKGEPLQGFPKGNYFLEESYHGKIYPGGGGAG